jgi:hypothetical protein
MDRDEGLPAVLTHYYRPFSRPFLSLSSLSEPEVSRVLATIARTEPLPYRLTHPDYLSERRRIEARMREMFCEKAGRPERDNPHYFVLGEFSLWETDASLKVELPLSAVPAPLVSFTLTDSFFNFRPTNLRGVPIPRRPYHGELFTLAELPALIRRHGFRETHGAAIPSGGSRSTSRLSSGETSPSRASWRPRDVRSAARRPSPNRNMVALAA